MDESSLGVHQVKFVVQSGPGFGDGGGVVQHAHRALDLGQVSSGNHGRGLIVNAHLNNKTESVHCFFQFNHRKKK